MLLGIDYGTTRTVVAAVDRGNYPVVSFHTAEGDTQDWYPSLIMARGDARLYGLDTARHQDDPDWALLRSFKRQLATLGPAAPLPLGTGAVTALELDGAVDPFIAGYLADGIAAGRTKVTAAEMSAEEAPASEQDAPAEETVEAAAEPESELETAAVAEGGESA